MYVSLFRTMFPAASRDLTSMAPSVSCAMSAKRRVSTEKRRIYRSVRGSMKSSLPRLTMMRELCRWRQPLRQTRQTSCVPALQLPLPVTDLTSARSETDARTEGLVKSVYILFLMTILYYIIIIIIYIYIYFLITWELYSIIVLVILI